MKPRNIFNSLQLLLALGIITAGTIQVKEKAALPLKLLHSASNLQIITSPLIQNEIPNTYLKTIDDIHVHNLDEVEFIIDGRKIGDTVNVALSRRNAEVVQKLILIPFYNDEYLVIQLIAGISFLLIGWFVFQKKRELMEAKIFYVLMIFASIIMLLTWGNYKIELFGIGYTSRILFSAAYLVAPLLFLDFTLSFPESVTEHRTKILAALSFIAAVLFIAMAITFLRAASTQQIEHIKNYLLAFDGARFFLSGCILSSIVIFGYSYKNLKEESQRRKLRWLLLGFVVGPLSFIALWVVPQAITGSGLIAEEYILLLMIAVPITFAISIMKYHIMNIDKLINRGTVYSVIFVILFLVYVSAIASTTFIVGSLTATSTIWISIIVSIFVALLFQPLKNITQKGVDKIFFQKRYEFRKVATKFNEKVFEEFLPDRIMKLFVTELNFNIPTEKSVILLLDRNEKKNALWYSENNFKPNEELINKLITATNWNALHFGETEWIESGVNFGAADPEICREKNFVLYSVVALDSDKVLAAFFGRKKSGFKFSYEDLDLIQTMLLLGKTSIEQFFMKQKLFSDLQEIEKLKELNELKSYFVSIASHELQTPLTSIKIFSELIAKDSLTNSERNKKFLSLIDGECNRLSSLINNILNFAKIENNMIDFQRESIDLNKLIEDAVAKMQYQLELNSFECNTVYDTSPVIINADGDAILEVFLNLISNSIKYSDNKKAIAIKIQKENSFAKIIFEDSGKGIDKSDLHKIFMPFERGVKDIKSRVRGIGLGLAIVKFIIEHHDGKIFVESKVGIGTKFTIQLPLLN